MNMEERLAELVRQEISQTGAKPPERLERQTMLAETGLDSLGFATIVVAMEREFRLDPFGGSDDIIYPETYGELVALYENQRDGSAGD